MSDTEFSKKWEKILKTIPEFKDTADAASKEELKKIVYTAEGNIFTIEKEKEQDEKLNAAREVIKELAAPYRDAVKVQTCKVKYALYLLDQKGENLDNKEE